MGGRDLLLFYGRSDQGEKDGEDEQTVEQSEDHNTGEHLTLNLTNKKLLESLP